MDGHLLFKGKLEQELRNPGFGIRLSWFKFKTSLPASYCSGDAEQVMHHTQELLNKYRGVRIKNYVQWIEVWKLEVFLLLLILLIFY